MSLKLLTLVINDWKMSISKGCDSLCRLEDIVILRDITIALVFLWTEMSYSIHRISQRFGVFKSQMIDLEWVWLKKIWISIFNIYSNFGCSVIHFQRFLSGDTNFTGSIKWLISDFILRLESSKWLRWLLFYLFDLHFLEWCLLD
jgi:hypothetical protein